MSRNNSRIKAMYILYHWDLLNNEYENIELIGLDSLLNEEIEFKYDIDFFNELVNGVKDNLKEIDKLIAICLTNNYTIDRLSFIDRALIRLATFELKYTKTDFRIIINEYVELSHCFSETDEYNSGSFNNKLLDLIYKRINDGR